MLESGAAARVVYAVSELNEILRALVEDSLPSLWVQGEISNFSKPSSGHWYFTLKDEHAQIRCAMFRKANYYIRPLPQNGDAVLMRAKASVYPGRGELQLIVEHLEPAGTGSLLRAFEELKLRLAAEGLFDSARKRPIVETPRRIGLITSGTGAALHDVLTTLARRWPLVEVLFNPVPVQGIEAAGSIVKALTRFSDAGDVDTVLLVRGGGSIEDLAAFNNEALARAIRSCTIPVITGIGHEIDITIADFAADLRAATPTAAAERATPDAAELDVKANNILWLLLNRIERLVQTLDERLSRSEKFLERLHPAGRLDNQAQRIDESRLRVQRATESTLQKADERLTSLKYRLFRVHPQRDLEANSVAVARRASQLNEHWVYLTTRRNVELTKFRAALNHLNPANVLTRGYAIVSTDDGETLSNAKMAHVEQTLHIKLAQGDLTTVIAEILI